MIDVDEIYYDAISLLERMIAIPSVSREENAVADMLQNQLTEWQLSPKRSGNNLWCLSPDFSPAKPTILLNSHIDTVKPVAGWTLNPFAPTHSDNRLYGLGSNDAGASVVSLLAAFRWLTQHEQHYNLIFLASCEEEVSGRGGIESILPMLPNINVAIVGEPTGLQPALAEKGLMVLDAEAIGVSGHAARNEGVNAIYIALDAIQKLRYFSFENESPTLGPVKITISVINAGTVHNVVPDLCSFVVDVRSTDAYTNQEIVARLQQLVAPVELTPRSTRLQPSGISEAHPIIQRIKTLGRQCFGSPTLSDQALLSCPSVKIGPGDSARSHTADEYICLEEIREAIQLYFSLLNGLNF